MQGLLCCNGFAVVWMYGGVGNEKGFIQEFRRRLQDCFCQEWFSYLESSERFELYSCFKTCLEREKYIESIEDIKYRSALSRFRAGVSSIGVHKHRHAKNEMNKNCPFCKTVTEDETHVIFVCPLYEDLRTRYLNVCNQKTLRQQLIDLCRCNTDIVISMLCRYLFFMLQRRVKFTSEQLQA